MPSDRLLFDSGGLGYSAPDGQILVHYPKRVEGILMPGQGGTLVLGPIPEAYWTTAPNAATAERLAIWRQLLDENARY